MQFFYKPLQNWHLRHISYGCVARETRLTICYVFVFMCYYASNYAHICQFCRGFFYSFHSQKIFYFVKNKFCFLVRRQVGHLVELTNLPNCGVGRANGNFQSHKIKKCYYVKLVNDEFCRSFYIKNV